MWHVSSRSSVATLRTAIHLSLTYLLTLPDSDGRWKRHGPEQRLIQVVDDCRQSSQHWQMNTDHIHSMRVTILLWTTGLCLNASVLFLGRLETRFSGKI